MLSCRKPIRQALSATCNSLPAEERGGEFVEAFMHGQVTFPADGEAIELVKAGDRLLNVPRSHIQSRVRSRRSPSIRANDIVRAGRKAKSGCAASLVTFIVGVLALAATLSMVVVILRA
jgi:hypothetical protein